ncbi:MAG: chemotaxis protein CheV [Nitrospinae bacterium]|nr:chemotaxis protein CheV [Nitrospinota bacterium]
MSKTDILLESGTNEVEILEFMLGSQSFGVNVSKIREILTYNPKSVSSVPEAYPSVMGVFILRDSTITLINLAKHLDVPLKDQEDRFRVVMVCSFNNLTNGFLVDGINQIHRCSWSEITPLPPIIAQHRPAVTSSVTINKRNILLIDLEHILADIYPKTRLVYHEDEDPKHAANIDQRHHERQMKHIVLAEDSPIVRAKTISVAQEVGYSNITSFDNGLDAFDHVAQLAARAKREGKPVTDYVCTLVTDVEMPQMDGLTVCRRVKEELGLKELPVVIFSSLINDAMIHKCKTVGADAWLNKLEIGDLVHMLDRLCLGKD